MNAYTKLIRIGTQQYSLLPISNSVFTSNNDIKFCVTTKDIIIQKEKIASKKQYLEHNCILQGSCKTMRRWQISICLPREVTA